MAAASELRRGRRIYTLLKGIQRGLDNCGTLTRWSVASVIDTFRISSAISFLGFYTGAPIALLSRSCQILIAARFNSDLFVDTNDWLSKAR